MSKKAYAWQAAAFQNDITPLLRQPTRPGMLMTRLFLSILLAGLLYSTAFTQSGTASQSSATLRSSLLNFRPTPGLIRFRFDYHFKSRHSLHLRAGYNRVRHGDLGMQDDEPGEASRRTGYRYYFRKGWSHSCRRALRCVAQPQLAGQRRQRRGDEHQYQQNRGTATDSRGRVLVFSAKTTLVAPSLAFACESM